MPVISASGPIRSLLARVKNADLILLIGGRLGEMPSQAYTLIDIPGPRQTFVHVFPGVEELGRVYRPHLAINAAPTAFAAALEGLQPPNELCWASETPTVHADFLAWTDKPTSVPGAVNLGEIIVGLREQAPARHRDLQRRRQLLGLGASLQPLSAVTALSLRRSRAPWLRRAGGDRHEALGAGAHG